MGTNEIMPHPLPLFGSGCGSTYGNLLENLAGVGVDNRSIQMLGYLQASLRLAHACGAYDDEECLHLSDDASFGLLHEVNDILNIFVDFQVSLDFLDTFF